MTSAKGYVAGNPEYRYPEAGDPLPPGGAKVCLLTDGGVMTTGQWRADGGLLAWCPMPKGDKAKEARIRALRCPIKVFEVTDGEWWAGESLEAACAEASRVTGEPYPEEGYGRQLDHDEMLAKVYLDDETSPPTRRSFAEQLELEVAQGQAYPSMFAAVDW